MSIKSEVQGFDISKNSAVIIGCGGLGTNAAVHLAGAGIGRLCLCDFDKVEQRNLNRQFFYTQGDAGKYKCDLLSQRLSLYAPECEIRPVRLKIESAADMDRFKDYDIIIIAADNIPVRKIIGSFCKSSGIPCVNGSIDGFFGSAYLYIPGKSPDLESAGMLREVKTKMRSPSMTAGIIGALEAKLAADYFLGADSQGKLFCFDGNEIRSLIIRGETND